MQILGALSQDTDSPSRACELTVVNGVLLGVRFKVVAGGNVLRCVVPGPRGATRRTTHATRRQIRKRQIRVALDGFRRHSSRLSMGQCNLNGEWMSMSRYFMLDPQPSRVRFMREVAV